MPNILRVIHFAAAAALTMSTGCSRTPSPSTGAPTTPLAPAPWSAQTLRASAVPAVYSTAWRAAENRSKCALLAPERLDAAVQSAQPRAATFSGGWGVAYDMPDMRSAFGVAGSGADAWSPDVYQGWPYKTVYADGSRAGYGLEGGTGTNWLAYIQIPGQQCLYNVWSRRGREHLEQLLSQIRFVGM